MPGLPPVERPLSGGVVTLRDWAEDDRDALPETANDSTIQHSKGRLGHGAGAAGYARAGVIRGYRPGRSNGRPALAIDARVRTEAAAPATSC